MISTLADLVRRFGRSGALPPTDADFVARVRERLEPVLVLGGFAFRTAESVAGPGARSTVVRYTADPVEFMARHPRAAGHLRAEGEPLDFWVSLDVDHGTVDAELESFQPAALLAAVRAGPGAPPRRRRVGAAATGAPADSIDRIAELLGRFFDAASS